MFTIRLPERSREDASNDTPNEIERVIKHTMDTLNWRKLQDASTDSGQHRSYGLHAVWIKSQYDTQYDMIFLGHRVGEAVYPEGHKYDGEWVGNGRSGWGMFSSSGGEEYEGEWRNDLLNGRLFHSTFYYCASHNLPPIRALPARWTHS